MPLITSSGQKVYGRHEQVPRPERKKKDDKKEDDTTTTSSTGPQEQSWDIMSLLKEFLGGLFLLVAVTWTVYIRKDGMLSVSGSVMSDREATVYSNYIEFSNTQTFLSPFPKVASTSNDNTQDDVITEVALTEEEVIDSKFLEGPCGDLRQQVFEGGQVNVEYTLSTPTSPTPILQTTTPVQFTVKPLHTAVLTGSTLPLLHLMANGMCKNQIKKVEFTKENFEKLLEISSTSSTSSTSSFNPTTNQFLLTLFPTLSTGPRKESQSTLEFPFTFEIKIVDVTSQYALGLRQKEEEQIKLRNGDVGAFVRATIGSIHPLVLILAYVGMRFGSSYYNRYRIKQYQKKRQAQAKANGAREEELQKIEKESVTMDDVVQDQVEEEVAKAIETSSDEKKND